MKTAYFYKVVCALWDTFIFAEENLKDAGISINIFFSVQLFYMCD